MIWSKIKKNIESGFSDSLAGRVKIYTTSYGSDLDVKELYNRGWITVDGVEVVNFSTPDAFFIHGRDLNATTPTNYPANAVKKEYVNRTSNHLSEKGEFSKFDLTFCCSSFMSMSIKDAMEHESPIIRMLCVLDKRLGKRRCILMSQKELHPLVRYFLDIRMEAERGKAERGKESDISKVD